MVCSDGLTSMVREPKLEPLLVGNDRSLEDLGRELIAAANAAGGRDNITVVLFTLEEVDAPAGHAAGHAAPAHDITEDDTNEYDTFTGEAVPTPRQGVSRPQGRTRHGDEAHARGAGSASDEAEAEYRASGTVALSAVRPRAQPIEEGQAHAPPRAAAAQAAPAARSRRAS